MDKYIKSFLNKMRCPLCKSQLDIIEKYKFYNFACATDSIHYAICLDGNYVPTILLREKVTLNYEHLQYILNQDYFNDGNVNSSIMTKKIDAEGRVLDISENIKTEIYTFKYKIIDCQNTNQKKIISRLKTVLLLQ